MKDTYERRAATWPARVVAFVKLGRVQFLLGGVILYGLGAAVALGQRPLDLRAYLWGQAAVSATQLMTHYANDYFDLEADRANESPTRWSGGSRVLASGVLAPRVALVAALVLGACAFALDVFIALRVAGSAAVFAVLVLALAASWEYSAPPLRLHSRGLGAPTVSLVVTVLTPLAGYLLQARGSLDVLPLLVAVVPPACAQASMIFVIDFPDAAGDRAAGKGTPVVRFGGQVAARLCLFTVSAPFVALPLLVLGGLPARAAIAVLFTSPLAATLFFAMKRGDWAKKERWPIVTMWSVAWSGLVPAAELAAFATIAIDAGALG